MAVCGKCLRSAPDGALFCSFCGESIKPAAAPGEESDPLIGRTLGGKYFIHQLLGHGGMGDVYKATHLTLDRPVVLKLLRKVLHSDQALVQRFHREARAASRLNHPNSINVIDFGQADDGTLFMAMEYLSGRSLERMIAEGNSFTETRVVHIGAQILAALAEAHALGIIHRDLKPANVMIESRRDEPDFVKVLDFGIAKLKEPGSGAVLTQAGIVCGTPGYMSAEQIRGEELDARSDLYAVGVILYQMLTGALPFDAETPMGLATKSLVENPPPFSARRAGIAVSPALEAVVMRALSRERNDRFASADDMRAALLACTEPAAPAARPTPSPASTMIFDASMLPDGPAARPGASAPGEEVAGAGQPVGEPAAAPLPPSGPGSGGAAGPSATAAGPPVARTPAPAAGTPAPVRSAPSPAAKTPAPARKTPPPPRRIPHEMDRETEEPAPSRSKMPIIAAAGVGGAVVVGLVVFLATRGPSKPRGEEPAAPAAPAPSMQQEAQQPAPPPAPPPAQPEAPPAQPAAPPVQPAPQVALPQAVAPPPPAPEPKPPPPSPAVEPNPLPRPEPRPAAPARSSKGIKQIGEELNSIKTPPESSGEGVLAVVATPWAIVVIDGREIGETPREVRLGAGSYRVKATHPALGTREQTVTVKPGKRQTWSPTFAN